MFAPTLMSDWTGHITPFRHHCDGYLMKSVGVEAKFIALIVKSIKSGYDILISGYYVPLSFFSHEDASLTSR